MKQISKIALATLAAVATSMAAAADYPSKTVNYVIPFGLVVSQTSLHVSKSPCSRSSRGRAWRSNTSPVLVARLAGQSSMT